MIKIFCDVCKKQIRVKGNYGRHEVNLTDADGHFYETSHTLCSDHAKELYEFITQSLGRNNTLHRKMTNSE